ncbi:hypothetical protein [Thiorhodococcus minor]|uniref:Uncharacterized protein n=1 Tax=Thiorhodococcus minor TaxID=57489 RepID=A0A6M0K2S7_9GAMM|nr:hypothetical protein [Thiorhodococcus minor]NEV64062.1 hypothetical protein [Thiorhodococcus minor]
MSVSKWLETEVDAGGSKLVLTFFNLIRGDLWVIGLDPDYRCRAIASKY